MSRIGKKPIVVPPGVKISQAKQSIKIDGPLGSLSREIPGGIDVSAEQGIITVRRLNESRQSGEIASRPGEDIDSEYGDGSEHGISKDP
jgi:ribosomal protein L6P/L9E